MKIVAVAATLAFVYGCLNYQRWWRNFDFIIDEMMFMADDSYRLPKRKYLRAAMLSFRSNPDI